MRCKLACAKTVGYVSRWYERDACSLGGKDMNWAHLALITIGASIVTSLTDWFFAGDWLHRRWTYPEILAAGCRSAGDCSDQSAAVFDQWSLFLCHNPAGHPFCRRRGQTGCCRVVDRPFATDPYKCRFHEASPDICDFLFDQLVSKTHSRRGYSRLVPPLTGRPKRSCWFTAQEDGQQTLPYWITEGLPVVRTCRHFKFSTRL
jgi:hypothetical protein